MGTLQAKDPAIIAVDGKTSRRSYARGKGRLPLHMVSAWATGQRLVLGQEALDVVFHDNLARLRSGHGPANMAVIRHTALNLLTQAKPTISLQNRRKKAAWNHNYLAQVIAGTA